MLVSEPEKVQIFGFMVIFPLTFTSNTFVPTETDAGLACRLGEGEPGVHAGRRVRGLLDGGAVAGPATADAAVGGRHRGDLRAPLSMRAFKRRI